MRGLMRMCNPRCLSYGSRQEGKCLGQVHVSHMGFLEQTSELVRSMHAST